MALSYTELERKHLTTLVAMLVANSNTKKVHFPHLFCWFWQSFVDPSLFHAFGHNKPDKQCVLALPLGLSIHIKPQQWVMRTVSRTLSTVTQHSTSNICVLNNNAVQKIMWQKEKNVPLKWGGMLSSKSSALNSKTTADLFFIFWTKPNHLRWSFSSENTRTYHTHLTFSLLLLLSLV